MNEFMEFLDVLSDDEFEEIPVDLDTFLYDEYYLNLSRSPLSAKQRKMVEALSQIYKYETLVKIWGVTEAERLKKTDFKEVILMWGKGSGKDFTTTVAFARIVYLLLCLKDPAAYYRKPPGDSIDLLNIATNAKQANNVFFKGFKDRITKCRWFDGRYKALADNIQFDKNITAYSGHSEREAWEGYNVMVCVLDEIAGFESEAEQTGTKSVRSNTADAIYLMYSQSVTSRFPEFGKLALLSFSRYKGDFIQQRYAKVVEECNTTLVSHKFKLHEELPDGLAHNEFEIEWEHDDIISYHIPKVWADKAPSWDVNPTKNIDMYKGAFWNDPVDSLTRFACMPPDAVDAMFKDRQKVERAFAGTRMSPFESDMSFKETFTPKENTDYYLHVDLGYSHDRAAVAMAHVEEWVQINYGKGFTHYEPMIVIDAVRYWTPKSDQNINFEDIEDYIISLKRRGFNVRLVTFDRWSSVQFRQRLENHYGMDTDLLSVAKTHYEDFSVAIQEERVLGYNLPLAVEEILQLRIIKGNKVDHPQKGSKDVSDALAGAVYNAIRYTIRDDNSEVDIRYLEPGSPQPVDDPEKKVMKPNRAKAPKEIRDLLAGWEIL